MANTITYHEFCNAVTSCGFDKPTESQHRSFVKGLPSGDVTTRLEAAMFLANIIHESGGLKMKTEMQPASNYNDPSEYNPEWAERLKNPKYAGKTYFGRGYIQLTWFYNYWEASLALFGDDRLCVDPELVANDEETAWLTTFWFWRLNVHPVASGGLDATINAINGEVETADQRKLRHQYFTHVREALKC